MKQNMAHKIFFGTELKLNINIEPIDGMTMDDYDFEVEVIGGTFKRSSIVIKKDDAIKIDSNNYVLLVDTEELGVGDIKCKITAYIPDTDFADTLRTEVSLIDTGINVINTI